MSTPSTPPDKPQGIPIWMALVILVLVALVGLAALGGVFYYMHGERAKVQANLDTLLAKQKQDQIDRVKAADEAKRALAVNRQNEVLTQARVATNALGQLVTQMSALVDEAAALKTSEDGKRLALHPQLVSQARAFYEAQLPTLPHLDQVTTRLEAARRIEQQLVSQLGTTFEPEAATSVEAQNLAVAANQDLQKVTQSRAILASLLQESKIKFTKAKVEANSPTLEDAIQGLTGSEATLARQNLAERTAEAKDQATETVAKAEAERIISEAKQEAEKIRAETEEKKAEVEMELALKKADQHTKAAKTQVAVQSAADEALKIQLRKKASDTQVQQKLAPFTTPGYWQLNTFALDKKPLSFSKIQGSGALEGTQKGGATMALIVSTSADKVRPRWNINPHLYTKSPNAIEKIREAQQLLIELGPILVEMGKLEP